MLDISAQAMEHGVLDVLAGAPLVKAAADRGMEAADLADAVDAYRAAGTAALEAQARACGWHQVRVKFADWEAAEHAAAIGLGPRLQQAQDEGLIAAWWFIRKAPWWRLRLLPGPHTDISSVKSEIDLILDTFQAAGLIQRWQPGIYESETAVFGGRRGIQIAHTLFHADSIATLDYMRRADLDASSEPEIGRRELSILLCSVLLRAAAQEWYEQGDVWHRVTRLRPLPPDVPTDRISAVVPSLRLLMTSDTTPEGSLFGPGGPLEFATPWAAAFEQAGRELGHAAGEATLGRGVRDVLAHHVIFHWNRLGLTARTQCILARAAYETVMNPADSPPAPRTVAGC